MSSRRFVVCAFLLLCAGATAQDQLTVRKDLRSEWRTYEDGGFVAVGDAPFVSLKTIYFELTPSKYPGAFLRLQSHRNFFVFINGKIAGEFGGSVKWRVDSIASMAQAPTAWIAVHQDPINARDLSTTIVSDRKAASGLSQQVSRPSSGFSDFVILAGLMIIVLFVVAVRVNPRLASDYFTLSRIFSGREAEDSQASTRLTSSSNIQFYVLCSLLIGYYLLIVLRNLPPQYALPARFYATSFGALWWQLLKISSLIFSVFLLKLLVIFALSRMFGMRGMARFHFFNWIRILIIVFGGGAVVLFVYIISRGTNSGIYVGFLSLIIVTLGAWTAVAFFKLSGRSEHSMFHLFSYICATEIIPLLITVKVLFQ